ncbi:nickel pincer cofactor biosynthesis protein LarC [Dethiosulfatarculus sandiegensis]|uniref:Putative nickel insertion protein n=1 Tax=Dethiosulfatarculus sandiegensis TaxID=1429043 RepID=A0A0D2IZG6_9BACT|nr:nickel pincer cofactor biosynthesis protein LarC [Dethiosulfatarculus sandiegensis]KIX11414.1 hypothetical protein X474_24420 [Dethiosulfatarculus sandiegensis]
MSGILYIDACGGVAGDMLAGAFLDLGWPFSELEKLVQALGLEGVEVREVYLDHMGIACRRIEVIAPPEQPFRGVAQVKEILSCLPEEVKGPAERVFERMSLAEGKVHGVSPEEVHFHEVGAVDAMVDVIATCGALAWLKPDQVVCSPLPLGRGFVDCAHGRLPLPAPAVLGLLEGAPVRSWVEQEETVTPTGAALVSTLAHSFGDLPQMKIKSSGTGGGERPSRLSPNIVRVIWGEGRILPEARQVVEITCHLDDQTPEDLPMVLDRFMKAGALDASAAPLYMKKGRPGLRVMVSCSPEKAEEMAQLVLEQTTSLGVRITRTERRCVPREIVTVESPWGPARVKRTRVAGLWCMHPEADDVLRISKETGLAPFMVRQGIISALERQEQKA